LSEQQQQSSTEPKEYSVIELDNAVQNGQITQQQRDQIFATQIERKTRATAREEAVQIVQAETQTNALDSKLKAYADVEPAIMDEKSAVRQRIAAEFQELVANGHDPKSLATEYAAVRAVMGPIERVKARKEGRLVAPDYFGDTASGQRLSPAQRREEDQWAKLPQRQRQHYETMITKGVYANRAACIAEMNWKRGGKSDNRGTA